MLRASVWAGVVGVLVTSYYAEIQCREVRGPIFPTPSFRLCWFDVPDSYFFVVADNTSTLLGMLFQAAGEGAGSAASAVGEAASATGDAASATPAGDLGAAGDGVGKPGENPGFLINLLRNPLVLPVGLFVMFYLLVLMPERRRQAEAVRKRSEIKKNDKVLTSAGIYGTVVGVTSDSDEIQLRIDDSNNTKIRITRSSIATILTPSKEDAASKD